MALSYCALISTPKPLGLDAAPGQFSEARALQHAAKLTENGAGRLVSHPSIEAGIHYITAAAQEIASAASSRHDIHVQVDLYIACQHLALTCSDVLWLAQHRLHMLCMLLSYPCCKGTQPRQQSDTQCAATARRPQLLP